MDEGVEFSIQNRNFDMDVFEIALVVVYSVLDVPVMWVIKLVPRVWNGLNFNNLPEVFDVEDIQNKN
jgi:hypothetical protein